MAQHAAPARAQSPGHRHQAAASARCGQRRRDIQGLRAVAVLAVVAFHAGVPRLTGGYVGVDVFFVISGYLITGLLWREYQQHRPAEPGALLRPAGQAALAGGGTGAAWPRLSPAPAGCRRCGCARCSPMRWRPRSTWEITGSRSWGPTTWPRPLRRLRCSTTGPSGWRNSSICSGRCWWSSPRCWPVAGAPCWRWPCSPSRPLHSACAGPPQLPSWAYFSLPTRAWELGVGALLALFEPELRRCSARLLAVLGWVGLAAILGGCTFFGATTAFPGTAALAPGRSGRAQSSPRACSGPLAGPVSLLRVGGLQALGRWSYSWYLWHWPVLLLAPAALGHALGLGARLLAALLSLLLAVLSYALVENPLHRTRPRIRQGRGGLLVGRRADDGLGPVAGRRCRPDPGAGRARHGRCAGRHLDPTATPRHRNDRPRPTRPPSPLGDVDPAGPVRPAAGRFGRARCRPI